MKVRDFLFESEVWDLPNVRHCQTCVVHTSSGIMTGSHLGTKIDTEYECQVRMNTQKTGGIYEDDVGSKVTHRIINFWVMGSFEPDADVIVWNPPETRISYSGPVHYIPQEDLDKIRQAYRMHVGDVHWLSTGFFTLGIASIFCDHLTFIGFSDKCHPGSNYHYYGNDPRKDCTERKIYAYEERYHKLDKEFRFFKFLNDSSDVLFDLVTLY